MHSLNVKRILSQTIQFSISTQFSSIWRIDRTLSGATTLGQSGPGSNGNEKILHIPQSSSISRTSSHCLESYPGHSLRWGLYSAVENKSLGSFLTCNKWYSPTIFVKIKMRSPSLNKIVHYLSYIQYFFSYCFFGQRVCLKRCDNENGECSLTQCDEKKYEGTLMVCLCRWLVFTPCQPLDYFIPMTLLFYSFCDFTELSMWYNMHNWIICIGKEWDNVEK